MQVDKKLDWTGKWVLIMLIVAAISIAALVSLQSITAPSQIVFIFQVLSFVSVVSSILCFVASIFLIALELSIYKKNFFWKIFGWIPIFLAMLLKDAGEMVRSITLIFLVLWFFIYWFILRKHLK